jgi:DNA-binding transcriptional LysR family regulator
MERVSDMRAFTAVAEALSFASAARRLGTSPAQISKLVSRLEDQLGARLLNRTTRTVSLTDTGRAYFERAREVLGDYDALQASVRDGAGPRGLIRISVPGTFGTWQVSPVLLDFAALHPQVSLEVFFSDRLVNLVEEGIDLAVRIADLSDSTLIARRLAPVRIVTCASRSYLEKNGEPKKPEDLAAHKTIIDLNLKDPSTWHFGPQNRPIPVRVTSRLRFANPSVCAAAARGGFGIFFGPAFVVADDLRRGNLRVLLKRFEPPPLAVYAVYPHARHLAPKVRALVDFLVERFAGVPSWHQGWK